MAVFINASPLRVPPPPSAPDLDVAAPADTRLKIHAYTIPAFGHFQTIKGVIMALAARGHNVTLVACERTRRDASATGLLGPRGAHGGSVDFFSLGPCPAYDAREPALAALIAGGLDGARGVFGGMVRLGREMAAPALEHYAADPGARLPHAIVFDADTYAAMDVSVAWRVPRVARVGTGLRDVFTSPLYVPSYSSGLSAAYLTGSSRGERLIHGALLAFSRFIIAPVLLPWLYSGQRRHWLHTWGALGQQQAGDGAPPATALPAAAGVASHRGLSMDESRMRADLPWDGVPTLYNSHWGLEHARPIAPYEALIGHSNDFLGDSSQPLGPLLDAWLSWAEGAPPVVYVGLGTLSILPRDWVEPLAHALASHPAFRFVWSVAPAQQADLPPLLRLSSARARCALLPPVGGDEGSGGSAPGEAGSKVSGSENSADPCAQAASLEVLLGLPHLKPRSPEQAAASAAPGSVLLVEWAPQLSVLLHPAVVAFATHGGMNGIAEGTYARMPLLCIPLFSDQPDNCAHAADKGFARVVRLGPALEPRTLHAALDALMSDAHVPAAVQEAWVRNVAAGGASAAVAAIEAAAVLPYGAHLASVPAYHFLPLEQRYNLDYWVLAATLTVVLALGVRACARAAWGVCAGGGGGKVHTS